MNEQDCKKIGKAALKSYMDGNYKKALSLYKEIYPYAFSITKSQLEHSIGLCYYSMGDYATAEQWYTKACENINFVDATFDKALAMLHQTKLDGFKYYYGRYIDNRPTGTRFPNLPLPKVTNLSQLNGKNILVLNEQGFGDEFMFSSSFKYLSDNCQSCHIQVYPETFLYFETKKFENVTYFTERSFNMSFVKNFDMWIPVGDLFALCAMNKSLRVDTMNNAGDNVAICTSGNPKSPNYHERKISDNLLKQFVQNGINLNPQVKSKLFKNPEIKTFNDTFELLKTCKYVVCSDTAIANLAAVNGMQVYLIYKDYLDWRWKCNFFENVKTIHISQLNDFDFDKDLNNV